VKNIIDQKLREHRSNAKICPGGKRHGWTFFSPRFAPAIMLFCVRVGSTRRRQSSFNWDFPLARLKRQARRLRLVEFAIAFPWWDVMEPGTMASHLSRVSSLAEARMSRVSKGMGSNQRGRGYLCNGGSPPAPHLWPRRPRKRAELKCNSISLQLAHSNLGRDVTGKTAIPSVRRMAAFTKTRIRWKKQLAQDVTFRRSKHENLLHKTDRNAG